MTGRELRAAVRCIATGRSARRALLNVELGRGLALKGRVLDVGGRGRPTYAAVLGDAPGVTWTVLDLQPGERVDAVGDLTALPFADGAFDAALCFNVLEHVWGYQAALRELRRVLAPDGTLYGYVPFLCEVHGAPADYWRLTRQALERSLAAAGLSVESMRAHGGPMAVSFDVASFVLAPVPPLRAAVGGLALLADRAILRRRPGHAERFPLGYYFVAHPAAVAEAR